MSKKLQRMEMLILKQAKLLKDYQEVTKHLVNSLKHAEVIIPITIWDTLDRLEEMNNVKYKGK